VRLQTPQREARGVQRRPEPVARPREVVTPTKRTRSAGPTMGPSNR
jgi:hypothetical protein